MSFETSLQLVEDGDGVQAFCEVRHPMGDRNYLTQIAFRVNNQPRADLLLGKYLSVNPVIGTRLEGLRDGDQVEVSWRDLSGATGRQAIIYRV